jgi:hypothetical protein
VEKWDGGREEDACKGPYSMEFVTETFVWVYDISQAQFWTPELHWTECT